jgi:hypothetical protein
VPDAPGGRGGDSGAVPARARARWLDRIVHLVTSDLTERGADPAEAARAIADLIDSPPDRFRHPVGRDARRLAWLIRLLPERGLLRMIRRRYGPPA